MVTFISGQFAHSLTGSIGGVTGNAKYHFGPAGDYSATLSATPFGGLGLGAFNYTAGSVVRGGFWLNELKSGVFRASLGTGIGNMETRYGFRCVWQLLVITSSSTPTNGTYTPGQVLNFALTFSEAVNVTGSPRFALTIGANTRYATYSSGSGTATLTFSYTVQAGDIDNNGIVVSPLIDLNGGIIKNAANITAALEFPETNTSSVLILDTP